MKNAEQFSADMKADDALRAKFREGLNKLRGDKTLSITEASRQVARELGYEISEEETKKLMAQQRTPMRELTDSELENVAGGGCSYSYISASTSYCENPFTDWSW